MKTFARLFIITVHHGIECVSSTVDENIEDDFRHSPSFSKMKYSTVLLSIL